MSFYLQDVSGGLPLSSDHTLAVVRVRVRPASRACGVIVAYHRVARLDPDLSSLAVTPEHFEEHLAVLRQCGRPVSIDGIARAADGGVHDRVIAVTFDDGYADNYQAAVLLRRHQIPATLFVTAGYLDHPRDFWWDSLRVLMTTPRLPRTLRSTIAGHVHEWHVDDADGTTRMRAFDELHRALRPLSEGDRLGAIDDLLTQAGIDPAPREANRQLSTEELRSLAQDGLMEVGSHTMTHGDLACLAPHDQRAELVRSRQLLEDIVQSPVRSFAYPYGSSTPATRELVREAGYLYACSVTAWPVVAGSDPLQLPRIMVEDEDGDAFARRLSWWLD